MPLIDVDEPSSEEGFGYFKGLCLFCFLLILFIYSLPGAIYLLTQPRDFNVLHADADSHFVNSEVLRSLDSYITKAQRIYPNESENTMSMVENVLNLRASISCKHLNLIVLTKSLIEVFHPNRYNAGVLNRKEIFTFFLFIFRCYLLLYSDDGSDLHLANFQLVGI